MSYLAISTLVNKARSQYTWSSMIGSGHTSQIANAQGRLIPWTICISNISTYADVAVLIFHHSLLGALYIQANSEFWY
ncbi:hypothetical protein Tco_1044858 [Tanacetum coccineum]|uniref:Uncharacterized protein n=1 Tax=Tanacetum coccineum TaxID=301880 RepID=A0ABQ5GR39_9ASTR